MSICKDLSVYDRRLIEIRRQYVSQTSHMLDAADLLDQMHAFMETCQPGNRFEICTNNPICFYEVRDENDDELRTRLQAEMDHALKVQKKADDSWERQKRKFAKNRRNK